MMTNPVVTIKIRKCRDMKSLPFLHFTKLAISVTISNRVLNI